MKKLLTLFVIAGLLSAMPFFISATLVELQKKTDLSEPLFDEDTYQKIRANLYLPTKHKDEVPEPNPKYSNWLRAGVMPLQRSAITGFFIAQILVEVERIKDDIKKKGSDDKETQQAIMHLTNTISDLRQLLMDTTLNLPAHVRELFQTVADEAESYILVPKWPKKVEKEKTD